MREFLRSRRFKVLLAVFAVLLGFMIYAVSSGDAATVPSKIISAIAAPFQKLSSVISTSVSDFLSKYADAGKNYEENIKLKDEVAELQKQLADYENLKNENEQLREVAGVQEMSEDYKAVGGTIIARDATDRYYSFVIDKGSKHGISELDPVVTSRGLVGIVSKVYPTSCRVITILSPERSVSAREPRTTETGALTGSIELLDEGKCVLKYLQRETAISKGNVICTSGESGRFPKNYVIGVVEEVRQQNDGKTAYAVVRPSEDIKEVSNVCVLIDFEGKGDADAAAEDGGE